MFLHNLILHTYRKFMVEALDLDDQAVLSSHQFIFQLSHVGLVSRFCQVVDQDIHKEVKKHQAKHRKQSKRMSENRNQT